MHIEKRTAEEHSVLLDILRCIAILGVILVHLTIYLPTDTLGRYMVQGKYGVQLFFVLSGFLCTATYRRKIGILNYWKKRACRILPAYYVAVYLGLLVHWLLIKDITVDSLVRGSVRYVFALNMILPAPNYDVWNNMYGLWSMSCFIGFYVFAPFIMKCVDSARKSIILIFLAVLIWMVWKSSVRMIWGASYSVEYLDMLSGTSFFGKLYQFCFGITVFYFLKDKKSWEGIAFFALCLAAGEALGRSEIVWCSIAAIMIIAAVSIEEKCVVQVSWATRFIKQLSAESYHIYLSHMIAFDIARIVADSRFRQYRNFAWLFIAVSVMILICLLMHFMEKLLRMVRSQKKCARQ